MNIYSNYNLKSNNTFGIEAKAKLFATITSKSDLDEIISLKNKTNLPILVIGKGSNLLFTKDYNGICINYKKDEINIINENTNSVLIEVYAGTEWDKFVEYAVSKNFYGIENLSIIPGTIGAAPVQNIGAYGVEVKDVIESVYYINLQDGTEHVLKNSECNFGYRTSIFKNELKSKILITKVLFNLSKIKTFKLEYKAINEKISDKSNLSLKVIRDAIINIRNEKLPDYQKHGNAGSFFKNPEISSEHLKLLKQDYPSIVNYELENGNYKIAAGWLIESCGLKGIQKGNVGTYSKQSLILINYGNATGEEILEFSKYIIDEVNKKFNILLESEVNII